MSKSYLEGPQAHCFRRILFRSGRTMARTGLRTMPAFPIIPPKNSVRRVFPGTASTLGYQQAPSRERRPRVAPSQFASCLRAHRFQLFVLRSVSEKLCAQAPPFKRLRRSTPGALAPVRVLLSRSILTYPAPSDLLAGTARFHCSAAYTPCLRCMFPPRRPATGSVLSPLILSQHVVLCDSGESGGRIHPVPSSPTLAFVPLVQTRHSHTSRKSVARGGAPFGASLRFACATTC
jgi:hypothetical protein